MTFGTKRKVSAPSKGLKWQNRFTALIVEEELDVAPRFSRNKCHVIGMGDSLLQGTEAPMCQPFILERFAAFWVPASGMLWRSY